jgi:hypothetical protein
MNVLLTQLGVYSIVNLPEPAREGSSVGRYGLFGDVLGQILTTIFTGEHKRKCLEEELQGTTTSLSYQV